MTSFSARPETIEHKDYSERYQSRADVASGIENSSCEGALLARKLRCYSLDAAGLVAIELSNCRWDWPSIVVSARGISLCWDGARKERLLSPDIAKPVRGNLNVGVDESSLSPQKVLPLGSDCQANFLVYAASSIK